MASGAYHVWYRCKVCQRNVTAPGPYLKKKSPALEGLTPDDLPVFIDYRANNPPCAVCGAIGTELHHFAPKELFPEDFELWPKSYLCKKHHAEWHNKITIPLRKYRNRERKNDNGQSPTSTGPGLSQ
jgi:hypothetical protein